MLHDYCPLIVYGVGVSTLRKAVSREKNSSGNLTIFQGIGKCFGKNEVIKLSSQEVEIF